MLVLILIALMEIAALRISREMNRKERFIYDAKVVHLR